jgi:hypothetical protein
LAISDHTALRVSGTGAWYLRDDPRCGCGDAVICTACTVFTSRPVAAAPLSPRPRRPPFHLGPEDPPWPRAGISQTLNVLCLQSVILPSAVLAHRTGAPRPALVRDSRDGDGPAGPHRYLPGAARAGARVPGRIHIGSRIWIRILGRRIPRPAACAGLGRRAAPLLPAAAQAGGQVTEQAGDCTMRGEAGRGTAYVRLSVRWADLFAAWGCVEGGEKARAPRGVDGTAYGTVMSSKAPLRGDRRRDPGSYGIVPHGRTHAWTDTRIMPPGGCCCRSGPLACAI